MTNGIPKSVGNNPSRKQTPKKSDKPPQGTPPVNGISRTGPITNGIKSPQTAYQEIQKNDVSSTSSSTPASDSSPDPPSTTTTSEAPEPPPTPKTKTEFDPTARAEARARLTARIEALRAKRHADGPDGAPARNRQELMEARRKKEAARKERKKELRLASKAAEEKAAKADAAMEGSSTDVRMQGTTSSASLSKPQQSKPIETNFSFGQVVFDDGQILDHTLQNFQKSRKRKGPTDVLGQMKHVEAKKARIANMLPEKQEHIAEKEMWSKALKQAQGEKVRDDEKLLKKALKRQEKTKKKSEREWKERTQSVVKSKFAKQKKRETNIAARKEQKKAGKNGVKKKKPAVADSKNRKNRKKSRPGFEGSMKSGNTAGGSGGGGGRKK